VLRHRLLRKLPTKELVTTCARLRPGEMIPTEHLDSDQVRAPFGGAPS
jgi:hypothetical protein